MDISIIVCTFNRCRLLEGNLAALSRQQIAPGTEWEVIVVDNNCTDDTAKVVAGMAEQFRAPLRRVEEAKQGLSNARNRGIAEARGRYLLFTDDDTRPLPQWAHAVWQTFQSSTCAAVGGKVELLWPEERPRWLADELLSTLAGVDYGECEIHLSLDQPPLGANMAFNREVFEKIGGFNPNLGRIGTQLLGGEETDLFKRLTEVGLSGRYQPRAIVNHVLEPERLRKAYFRKVYFYGGHSRGLLFAPASGRRFAGVPLFSIRQLLQKSFAYFAAVSEGSSQSFVKELHAWWLVGFMAGCSRSRQRRQQT